MLLSPTSRKGKPDADLQAVQNPEHALVSNNQEQPARCWLTNCLKPKAFFCQQQAGKTSQMLSHLLFKNTEDASVSNKQEGPARCWLTCCSKFRACSCQQQAGSTRQILTYTLFRTHSMLLSVTIRKSQPDPALHAVQHPKNTLVRNKQERPARSWLTYYSKSPVISNNQEGPAKFWLTYCSKPRAWSCQQQPGRASQILTYILFKSQSMILSATTRKGQPDPDLQPVQNPEHDFVSNNQEGPARCWLTACSTPRAWSCQQQPERASQMLTYSLFKTQSMILSATTRKGQLDADLHPVQSPEHPLVSKNQAGPASCWLTH